MYVCVCQSQHVRSVCVRVRICLCAHRKGGGKRRDLFSVEEEEEGGEHESLH